MRSLGSLLFVCLSVRLSVPRSVAASVEVVRCRYLRLDDR